MRWLSNRLNTLWRRIRCDRNNHFFTDPVTVNPLTKRCCRICGKEQVYNRFSNIWLDANSIAGKDFTRYVTRMHKEGWVLQGEDGVQ